jgi:hypothetical protein
MTRIAPAILIITLLIYTVSFSQSDDNSLSLEDILAKADSVSNLNDSLLADKKYNYKSLLVFNRIDGDGNIEKSDTTIAIITRLGDEELSREVIYSSNADEGRRMKGQERKISFTPDNPDYEFSLTDFDKSSYKIAIVPRESPPDEGDFKGTVEIDARGFFVKRIDLEVPDPEGAMKEYAIDMDFKPLEGGLVVPTDVRMRGSVKALLGIVKVRFTGEIRFTDYRILE